MSYPLHLDLRGRLVVVVGGGMVGERRVFGLLEQGAGVKLISPVVTAELAELAAAKALVWEPREFQPHDLDGAWLVQICTNATEVNQLVASAADAKQIWWVRADAGIESAAHTPAVGRVDGATVSITSGDPQRSKTIRNETIEAIRLGEFEPRSGRAASNGLVTLVGGGPGADDLITVRGLRVLRQADVVVFDRLSPNELLANLRSDVELIDAGKRPDHHTLTQTEINEVLVDRALAGKRVVRLKGGDPFVLGRGGEEVLACIAAGVDVNVVPGVTSAISAPAAAGIPVTHRGVTTGFAVVSGHELPELTALATTNLTLIVLMGIASLGELISKLIDAGVAATRPLAVVQSAWTSEERTLFTTVGEANDEVIRAGISNPAVIVVGDVVNVGREVKP